MKIDKKILLAFLVILATVSGLSFCAGMEHQKKRDANADALAQKDAGTRPVVIPRQSGGDASFMSGKIVDAKNGQFTLEPLVGSSTTVFLGDTTTIMQSVAGKQADIENGVSISLTGTTNPDGSVNARSLQIHPK
jgi:hypothetical protein